jgi:hypothetical protein
VDREDELDHEPEEEEEEEEESTKGSDFSFLLEDRGEEETSAEKAAREEAEEKARQRNQITPPTPNLDQQTLDILAELKKNPDALKRVLSAEPTKPIADTTTAPPLDIAKLTEELEADFLVDPKKAFAKLIGIGQQYMAEQRKQTEATVSQAGMGAASTVIDSYMEKVRNDPKLDPEVADEMQAMVDEAIRGNAAGIARSSPADIRKALDNAKATAVGKVYLKNGAPKPPVQRSARAPVYGSRGSAAANRTPTRDDLPKNEAERSLVLGLREGGCTPKEIVASLREFRADQGGPRTNRRAG